MSDEKRTERTEETTYSVPEAEVARESKRVSGPSEVLKETTVTTETTEEDNS